MAEIDRQFPANHTESCFNVHCEGVCFYQASEIIRKFAKGQPWCVQSDYRGNAQDKERKTGLGFKGKFKGWVCSTN